jgi:hypothetical protein
MGTGKFKNAFSFYLRYEPVPLLSTGGETFAAPLQFGQQHRASDCERPVQSFRYRWDECLHFQLVFLVKVPQPTLDCGRHFRTAWKYCDLAPYKILCHLTIEGLQTMVCLLRRKDKAICSLFVVLRVEADRTSAFH